MSELTPDQQHTRLRDEHMLKAEGGGAIEQVMTLGGSEVDITAYVGGEQL